MKEDTKITKKQAIAILAAGLIVYALCFTLSILTFPEKILMFVFFGAGLAVVLLILWKTYKSKNSDWK